MFIILLLVKKQIKLKGGDTETGWATYLVDGKGQIIEQLSVANRYNNFTEDSLAVIKPNGLGAFLGMGYNFIDYDVSIYKTDGKLSDDEKKYTGFRRFNVSYNLAQKYLYE